MTPSPILEVGEPPERYLAAVRAIRNRRRRRQALLVLMSVGAVALISIRKLTLPFNSNTRHTAWFESMLPAEAPLNAARSIDIRAGDRSLPAERF